MSSEKNLRVRVKVFDNSTTIYSQDVEIIQGEGTFVVPAMLSDNEIIVLQVSKTIIKIFFIISRYCERSVVIIVHLNFSRRIV